MCCVRLPGGGTATYAWGRGDDGQLGSGDRRDRRANPRVAATAARVNSVGQRPLRGLACGWAHTVFVVDAPPSSLLETPPRALLPRTPPAPGLRAPRAAAFARVAFSRGDVDGVCGQLLGTVLSLVVIQKRTVAVSGLSPAFVSGTLLPGCAVATAAGNVCFALMALAVGPNATAQPQGVSAVLLAVILSQVVAPERASRGDAVSSYEAALFVASLVGFLELLMAPFVAQLKASVPSAALHASVAGQALVGLTMGFAGDVFAAPADALGPLVVCFCCYGAQVRLPYNAPGGAGALALGALLAAPLRAVFGGDAGGGRAAGPVPWATLAVVSPPSLGGLPHLARAYASRESLKYVPVAIPLAPTGAGNERDIPRGASLGRCPLVSADFWTSDRLSERCRGVDAVFRSARARNARVESPISRPGADERLQHARAGRGREERRRRLLADAQRLLRRAGDRARRRVRLPVPDPSLRGAGKG